MNDDPLILYVLMREDLPDYQPGKCMAQANHAGTKFVASFTGHSPMLDEWLNEAGGFGTCVVLGVSYRDMRIADGLASLCGHRQGIIFDPTYPIRDGDTVQTIPCETCSYIFGRKSVLGPLLSRFKLFGS